MDQTASYQTASYKSFPVFRLLNSTQIDNFVSACEEITIPPGTVFIEQGEPGDRLYLVMSGESQVFLNHDGGEEQELVVLRSPAVIGEMEMLTGSPRSASVRAKTELRALLIDFDVLQRRIQDGDPATLKVFYQIARVLAHRLAAMNEKMAELRQLPEIARIDDLHAFQQQLVNEWTV